MSILDFSYKFKFPQYGNSRFAGDGTGSVIWGKPEGLFVLS